MVTRLDRHLAMELAPLARAFSGMVVSTELEAYRGQDPSSRIFDRSLINGADLLGYCGQTGRCELSVPFACYPCRHFQPWADGPHEMFLDKLISERDEKIMQGYSSNIYGNRDRIIYAVSEVIQLCSVADNDDCEKSE